MISYNSNKIITDVYKIIVEQSNKEFFFNKIKIKPVFESRIEIFQLNLIIIIWFFGLKNYNKNLTKGLVDFFINDLESAIREMGVSDTSIGRKTRTLVENFYGRLYSYYELFKAESVSKNELTAKAVSLAFNGFTPIISAAISISRIAIQLRPSEPRVRFRARIAETNTNTRQTK